MSRGECGTYTAYGQHLRHGEKPCPACRAVNAAYQKGYQARRREESAILGRPSTPEEWWVLADLGGAA